MNHSNQFNYSVRLSLVLCISGITFTGCTVTRVISTTEDANSHNDSISVEAFNNEINQRSVTLRFRDGHEYRTNGVFLSRDSVEYENMEAHSRIKSNTNSIEEITWQDHIGGALDGAIFSILPVLVVSLDRPDVGGGTHPGGGVTAGLAVGGVGILLGAVHGKDHVYKPASDFAAPQSSDEIKK